MDGREVRVRDLHTMDVASSEWRQSFRPWRTRNALRQGRPVP